MEKNPIKIRLEIKILSFGPFISLKTVKVTLNQLRILTHYFFRRN